MVWSSRAVERILVSLAQLVFDVAMKEEVLIHRVPPSKKRKRTVKEEEEGSLGTSKNTAARSPLSSRRVYCSFAEACRHYGFPGSHQVGSYGPRLQGIVRSYSNATPGKDKVLEKGQVVLYRLKADEKLRAQFKVNMSQRRHVRVFRKVATGAMDLGLFRVAGFVDAGEEDRVAEFGPEFVRYERVDD